MDDKSHTGGKELQPHMIDPARAPLPHFQCLRISSSLPFSFFPLRFQPHTALFISACIYVHMVATISRMHICSHSFMVSMASNLSNYLIHPSPSTTRPPTSSEHPRPFLLPTRRRRRTSSCWTATTSLRLPCPLQVTVPPTTNSKFRPLHHLSSSYKKNMLSTCSCFYYNRASTKDDDSDDDRCYNRLHHDMKYFSAIGAAAGKAAFGILAAASAFFSLHSHSPALADSLTVAFPASRAREVLTHSKSSTTTPAPISFASFFQFPLLLLLFYHLI